MSGSDLLPEAVGRRPDFLRRPTRDRAVRSPGPTVRGRAGCTITEAAAASGVTVRTLRYYEEIGLIDPPRTPGRDRIFAGELLLKVKLLCQLRLAGVDLPAIVGAFRKASAEQTRRDLISAVETRLSEVERDLCELRDLRAALERSSADTLGLEA